MNKGLYTVVVDSYFPELCNITIPLLKKYADKIGAKFTIINNRKFPDFPAPYEKLQVYELGKSNDINILIDCDILINPNIMYDVSEMCREDSIGSWMSYNASAWYNDLRDFKQDNRNIGLATNFLVVPKKCHNLFKPLECKWEDARLKVKREFIIDEYAMSKNMAKHKFPLCGLIYDGVADRLFKHLNFNTGKLSKECNLSIAKIWNKQLQRELV